MKTYAQKIPNRKELVKRLEELTRKKARYTFVPRCAFEVGEFTVEKDGKLTTTNDADELIIGILTKEGMIGALISEDETPVEVSPEISLVTETTEEWGDDEQLEDEPPFIEESPAEVSESEPETIPESDMDESQDSVYENADSESDECLCTRISFSLNAHTVQSLTNLICMIHSRGPLISKATGGTFFADKELVDSICERYWQLCDAEISEALSLHAPSSPESGMTFSTVYIDAYGHLVSEEEDFDAAISLAAFGEAESGSTDAIHQLALSVHRHRAATARELESELAELEAQDARKKILDSQPDLEDL